MATHYRIDMLPSAVKELADLPRRDQEAVALTIASLAETPHPVGCKKLKGSSPSLWRVRAGDYRVLYRVSGEEILVLIVKVAHRREVYRGR